MDNVRIQALVASIHKDVLVGLGSINDAFERFHLGQKEFKKRTEVLQKIAETVRNPQPFLAEAALTEAAREQALEDEIRRRYDLRYYQQHPADEPVKRGRPSTGKAMTSTERSRRRRARNENATKIPLPTANDDLIQEQCLDCETPTQFWQTSLANAAGDAVAMQAYWTRQFGDWQSFDVPTVLVTLAKQAATEWTELAKALKRRTA